MRVADATGSMGGSAGVAGAAGLTPAQVSALGLGRVGAGAAGAGVAAALRTLTERPSWTARPGQGVLVRTGAKGCMLAHFKTPLTVVPGFPVAVVDSNGAGDTHTGAFIAALAAGEDAAAAARRANAAAALSVTRHGPATAPTAAELGRFLSGHPT